ncbi:MAG: hypothetical protein QG629_389 [Patescibacteria group bacterium]|nr:hypothetical protein [Patescibacteria group bacterium]
MKLCVVSYNAIPDAQNTKAEGTGLRYWRIANALASTKIGKVSLAVRSFETKKTPEENAHGVTVVGFPDDPEEIRAFLKPFDVVIFSFAFGEFSKSIIDNAPKRTQLICDAYSPYYIEALTKSADKKKDQQILAQYRDSTVACSQVLLDSDYALIANETQKSFYEGLIAGLGGAVEYDFERLIELPGYTEETHNPEDKVRGVQKKPLRMLWFGGMYPWFDASNILDMLADDELRKLVRLDVVGGWNPIYDKSDKRFNGQFVDFKRKSDKLGLTDEVVFFQDWVEYDDRLNIFRNTDLALSVNNPGPETKYSFRLRVADLAGNGVPILTNGGDPLSDMLIASERAIYFDFASASIPEFKRFIKNYELVERVSKNLRTTKSQRELHIEGHIHTLARVIKSRKIYRHNKVVPTLIDRIIASDVNGRRLVTEMNALQQEKDQLQDSLKIAMKDLDSYREHLREVQQLYDETRAMYRRPLDLIKKIKKKLYKKERRR